MSFTGGAPRDRVDQPFGSPRRALFLDELTSFPSGAHGDMVDALIHALTYLRNQPEPGSFLFAPVGRVRNSALDHWREW